jgi:hypothetical protein
MFQTQGWAAELEAETGVSMPASLKEVGTAQRQHWTATHNAAHERGRAVLARATNTALASSGSQAWMSLPDAIPGPLVRKHPGGRFRGDSAKALGKLPALSRRRRSSANLVDAINGGGVVPDDVLEQLGAESYAVFAEFDRGFRELDDPSVVFPGNLIIRPRPAGRLATAWWPGHAVRRPLGSGRRRRCMCRRCPCRKACRRCRWGARRRHQRRPASPTSASPSPRPMICAASSLTASAGLAILPHRAVAASG